MIEQRHCWEDFVAALDRHFGTLTRSQTNFSIATGYGISTIQHWRKTNSVPADAFRRLREIDASKYPTTIFDGRHPLGFVDRIIALSNVGEPNLEIARIMSQEFEKTVTENMVKGVRLRNKERIWRYSPRPKKKPLNPTPKTEHV